MARRVLRTIGSGPLFQCICEPHFRAKALPEVRFSGYYGAAKAGNFLRPESAQTTECHDRDIVVLFTAIGMDAHIRKQGSS